MRVPAHTARRRQAQGPGCRNSDAGMAGARSRTSTRPRGWSSTDRSIQTRGPSSGRVAGASAVLPCSQRRWRSIKGCPQKGCRGASPALSCSQHHTELTHTSP